MKGVKEWDVVVLKVCVKFVCNTSVEDANQPASQQHLRSIGRTSSTFLTQISLLLSRENLCSSLYLARFITPTLTLSLQTLLD